VAPEVQTHVHRTGLYRREVLHVGFLGALGITLDAVPPARAGSPAARSVILVWMPGGPPQMQLWDLKPDSPAECRGSARPIPTTAPGIEFGHWLPRTARQAHHLALLRSLTLDAENDNHNIGHHKLLSAVNATPPGSGDYASRVDWPSMSAVAGTFRPSEVGLPSAVHLPLPMLDGGKPDPGQNAGWMGSRHDPWQIQGDPNRPDFRVPDLTPLPGYTVERLDNRRRLLAEVDRHRRDLDRDLGTRQLGDVQRRAFEVATGSATRHAFDLAREPASLRDGYGRHTFGQSLLLARRLVEAGVRFVQVNRGAMNTWDLHQEEDRRLEALMPPFDQGFSALLEDLQQRGLLRETLVLCLSEMGRNPRLGAPTSDGTPGIPDGRNHWQWCWTALFAGAGVRGGTVVGASDAWSAYPEGDAYRPADVGATVYAALGIDPRSEARDPEGQPRVVNQGLPIASLFHGR